MTSTLRYDPQDDAALTGAALVVASFSEPVMILDLQQRIISWNSACEAMSGKAAADAVGATLTDLFPKAGANRLVGLALAQARKGFYSFLPEEDCSYTPGHFDNRFMPLKNALGRVIGIIHSRHDIAHRVKSAAAREELVQTLVRKNKQLQEMSETYAAILEALGRHLYEPLRRMYGFTNLLLAREEDKLSEKGRFYFSRVKVSLEKMDSMITGLLGYAVADEQQEKIADVNLNQLFRFIRNNVSGAEQVHGNELHCDRLPLVRGYRSMLYILFRELVSNATKFCRPGEAPRITVRSGAAAAAQTAGMNLAAGIPWAWISITDNGIGLGEAQVPDIFRLLYRSPAAAAYTGNGIGLALCKRIVEKHGGSIEAQAAEGGGTTITCLLPLAA